jgi:hypothetical protein
MIKLLFILNLLLASASCNERVDKQIKKNNVVSIKIVNGIKIDTSINNVILEDTITLIKKFGDLSRLIDLPNCDCVTLFNKNETQFLRLHHSNGGFSNQFDIFTVEYIKKSKKNGKTIEDEIFITENGIKLGISLEIFFNRFPNTNFVKQKLGLKQVKYIYHDVENTYLAEYVFKDEILISFRIGYDNS